LTAEGGAEGAAKNPRKLMNAEASREPRQRSEEPQKKSLSSKKRGNQTQEPAAKQYTNPSHDFGVDLIGGRHFLVTYFELIRWGLNRDCYNNYLHPTIKLSRKSYRC